MTPDRSTQGPDIGAALKDARRRIGMDVKEAEDRTKIRAKYLRALEAEDWEVLPAPAYVRGFLRTYGQLLGLDGEMLADEYRRRHEESAAAASPASEPLLQGRQGNRRSSGSRPPSRGGLIAAVGAAIVVLLIVLSFLGDGDEPAAPEGLGENGAGKADGKGGGKGGGGSESQSREPVDLILEPLGSVQVCLASSGEALIDAQVLAEGATEEFGGAKRYRIDLQSGGAVKVDVGGDSEKLEADGEASWEADSNGIREIDYAGPECP